MPRYLGAEQDIFSIFATAEWNTEGIKAYPSTIVPDNPGQEYIRISIVPSGQGLNYNSVSGLLLIDIFTARAQGPKRPMQVADILDTHFNVKISGNSQFMSSSLGKTSQDRDDPALCMTSYSIAFNYFGET